MTQRKIRKMQVFHNTIGEDGSIPALDKLLAAGWQVLDYNACATYDVAVLVLEGEPRTRTRKTTGPTETKDA